MRDNLEHSSFFFRLFGAHKHSAANVKRAINSFDPATVISRPDGKLHRQLASVVYYEIKTLPDKTDLKFAPRLCRSNALVFSKSNFRFESLCATGHELSQDFDEIRSTLCGFHFYAFSRRLLPTVFDAFVSFKVQPTEMTDLRGSRHALRSRSLSYFKYTRETLNAPTENNESIVRCVYIENNEFIVKCE